MHRRGEESASLAVAIDEHRAVLREDRVVRTVHERQQLELRVLRPQFGEEALVLATRAIEVGGADAHVRVDRPGDLVAALGTPRVRRVGVAGEGADDEA